MSEWVAHLVVSGKNGGSSGTTASSEKKNIVESNGKNSRRIFSFAVMFSFNMYRASRRFSPVSTLSGPGLSSYVQRCAGHHHRPFDGMVTVSDGDMVKGKGFAGTVFDSVLYWRPRQRRWRWWWRWRVAVGYLWETGTGGSGKLSLHCYHPTTTGKNYLSYAKCGDVMGDVCTTERGKILHLLKHDIARMMMMMCVPSSWMAGTWKEIQSENDLLKVAKGCG